MAQKETSEELSPEDRNALRQYYIAVRFDPDYKVLSALECLEVARDQFSFEKDNF